MNKTIKLALLLVALVSASLVTVSNFSAPISIKSASASPALVYSSSPTNYTFSPGVFARFPDRAYDGSNGTSNYAFWAYTAGANYGTSNGYFELNVYGPRANPPRGSHITRVDLKVAFRVTAVATATDPVLYLNYQVSPSTANTSLQSWTRPPLAWYNVTYANQPEPNDGVWTWEDLANLKFRFNRMDPGTPSTGGQTSIYEVWAAVTYEPTQIVAISPKSQTPIPSSVKINVTGIEELYGFEFRMTYNTTAIDVTSIQLGPYLNTTAGGTANTFGARIKLDNTAGIAWATQTIRGNLRGGNIASGTWQTLATINIATHGSGGPTNLNFDIKLAGLNYLIKKAYPGSFTLIQPGHDVAVTSISATPTSVTRGDNVNVNVNVKNEGDYVETFFLLTYANTSAGTTLVENRTITNLARGATQAAPVTWNTRTFGSGNYTVSATAVTRGVLDADSADNTKYGTLVEVNPRFGDINEDGWVDGADIVAMNAAWGTQPGNPLWSIAADLNPDSKIDAKDLRLLGRAWQAPP